jgi:hypothetical protein
MSELQLALSPPSPSPSSAPPRVPQALFCVEELLLIQPNTAAFHARAAELLCRIALEAAATGGGAASFAQPAGSAVSAPEPGSPAAEREAGLRRARLHASEAVRLTRSNNAYALATLADAAYLHWCAVLRKAPKPGARLLYGVTLDRTADAIAAGSRGSTGAAAWGGAGGAADADAVTGSIDNMTLGLASEDVSLHGLAVHHLTRLAAAARQGGGGGGGGEAGCGGAAAAALAPKQAGAGGSMAEAYPALAVEAVLLADGPLASLRLQSGDLEQRG